MEIEWLACFACQGAENESGPPGGGGGKKRAKGAFQKKKEHDDKHLAEGWGFHVKGWGSKSSVCPSKTRENKRFSDREIHATTPHKIDNQHRECKTWGGAYFAFFLASDNSHTTPPKIPPDDEGLLWGWCVVGGPLFLGRILQDFLGISRKFRGCPTNKLCSNFGR